MDGRPNRRNKAPFSNFSGVVWKGPKKTNSVDAILNLNALSVEACCPIFDKRGNQSDVILLCIQRTFFTSTSRSRNKLMQQSAYKTLKSAIIFKHKEVITNQRFYNFNKKVTKMFIFESRNGAVLRALASHQCGLRPIPAPCHTWVEFVVGFRFTPRIFLPVLQFSSFHRAKPNISKFQKSVTAVKT